MEVLNVYFYSEPYNKRPTAVNYFKELVNKKSDIRNDRYTQ